MAVLIILNNNFTKCKFSNFYFAPICTTTKVLQDVPLYGFILQMIYLGAFWYHTHSCVCTCNSYIYLDYFTFLSIEFLTIVAWCILSVGISHIHMEIYFIKSDSICSEYETYTKSPMSHLFSRTKITPWGCDSIFMLSKIMYKSYYLL